MLSKPNFLSSHRITGYGKPICIGRSASCHLGIFYKILMPFPSNTNFVPHSASRYLVILPSIELFILSTVIGFVLYH